MYLKTSRFVSFSGLLGGSASNFLAFRRLPLLFYGSLLNAMIFSSESLAWLVIITITNSLLLHMCKESTQKSAVFLLSLSKWSNKSTVSTRVETRLLREKIFKKPLTVRTIRTFSSRKWKSLIVSSSSRKIVVYTFGFGLSSSVNRINLLC